MPEETGLLAGRAALDRGAWEAARDAFEAALRRQESPEVLEGLGWSLYWLDHVDDALAARERAFALFRERGERRDAARVACSLAVDCVELRGEAPATGWLERARRVLDGVPSCPEHGWVALWEAHFALLFRRDRDAARQRGADAAAIAHAFGLVDLEMLTVALEGLLLVGEGNVDEGMRRLDEATAAAVGGEIKHLGSVTAACCLLVHACERVRDYGRAAQWAERVEQFSREWGIAPAFTVCRTQYAAMLIGQGEWAAAEVELVRASERLAASRPALLAESLEQLGELRRRQGRWDEAEELFARAAPRSLPLLGAAAIALGRGEPAQAADLLDRFFRRTPPDNWTGRAAALELGVRAQLALADPAAASLAATRLDELAERVGTPPIRATARLARGVLAAASGACDEARRLLEDAVDLFQASHAPFEAARARLELARCLGRLGRAATARQEARAALEQLQRLGAAREAFAAEQLLRQLDTPVPSLPAAGSGLTGREIEVLRLVARGLGDKEIAEQLGVSGHTVHRHVSNIRTKLSLPSRAAAVAWAAQNGLL